MIRTHHDSAYVNKLLVEAAMAPNASSLVDTEGWARIQFKKNEAAVEVFVGPNGDTFAQTIVPDK